MPHLVTITRSCTVELTCVANADDAIDTARQMYESGDACAELGDAEYNLHEFDENIYRKAIQNVAEQLVEMVREDYPTGSTESLQWAAEEYAATANAEIIQAVKALLK